MVINMKNKAWILIIIFAILAIIFGIYFFTKNNDSKNNYTASRSSVNEQKNINIDTNVIEEKSENNNNNTISNNVQKSEELISTFSTKIYNPDSNRQNNITITCQTLNDTIVPNGSTFSFCDTVGKATTERGYLKADVFDKDGNKTQGIGGGNCQVSSTLYNALLPVPELPVVERHPHSNKVPYVEPGKDAAVAYGSYDLKFRNDFGFDVKIVAQNSAGTITVTLYKIV